MVPFYVKSSFKSLSFLVLLWVISAPSAWADGTKQVSPVNNANGAALLIAPDIPAGPYRNAPNSRRLRFSIANHTTENLYFGLHPRSFSNSSTSLVTNAYYRIYNNAGTLVAGPTLIPTSGTGFIANYNQAIAGPNIGGATPSGYTPFLFDPTANGDYYVELYRSDDGGTTAQTGSSSGRITFPFFDFTVATTSNTQFIGRLWSREWSFVTTNLISGNFEQSSSSSFTGSFFAYTQDNLKLKIDFSNGFRPLAFQAAVNFSGVGTTGNFQNDRRSVNSTAGIPTLPTGYQVFLTNPEVTLFPNGVAGSAALTTRMYGCPTNYYVPFQISQPGDVSMVIDFNGVAGYQAGTSDRLLESFGVPAGQNLMPWNGLDGLGNTVPPNVSVQITVTVYQGRTNLPLYDAELNTGGISVTGIFPPTGNRKLYWDDSQITQVGSTCDNNDQNITTGGVQTSILPAGVFGPSHGWDGSNPGFTVPAPQNGQGSATTQLCDDYGNVRTLNTWFYAAEFASPITNMTVPTCDTDNDGISDPIDIDDDNDGIPDAVEHAGLSDPLADDDGDGIYNYIDITQPGFVDSNGDGLDDRYDWDLDGVINSFDLDSDNDGIHDILEAGGIDNNNDGRLDNFSDHDQDGLGNTVDPDCNGAAQRADFVQSTSGTVSNSANAVDNSASTQAEVQTNGGYIDVRLQSVVPAGTVLSVSLSSNNTSAANGTIASSFTTTGYANSQSYSVSNTTSQVISYTTTADTRYLRISKTSGSNVRVYIVTYTSCNGTTGIPLPVPNTDGLLGPDYLDRDSDEDGCNDTQEAGFTDQNTDGILGALPTIVNNDGKVTGSNVLNGYTASNPNVTTAGTPISITTQPSNQTVFAGQNASFTVNAAGSNPVYQWQRSTDGGTNWTNVTNGGTNPVFGGSTASTLTLTNVPQSMTGNLFRVRITSSTYVCSDVTSASRTLTVNPSADLAMTKTVSNATPNAGTNVTFTLTVTNNGPSNATGVSVNDLLPSGYTFVSANPSAAYNATTGVWTVGAVNSGANAVLTIIATVNGSGNYTNTASVSSGINDPNTANNSSSVSTTPVPQTNLGVNKTASSSSPAVGSNITFTIVASNAGPSNATGVIVNDVLPSGYTFVNATTTAGSYVSGTGVWNIGNINNGASATLNITATVNASGSYANTATITGNQNDPIPGNNSSTSTPTPVPQTNLGITKTVNNSSPNVGGSVTFTLTATNFGPSAATGVSVTDLLPSGYSYNSHNASAGTTYNTGNGVWTIGSLTNGASATLTITATVNATGSYANTATITGNENDPTPGNNSSTSTPTPVPQTDLSVVKTVSNATPSVGSSVTFTVVAANGGPSAATGVSVTDLLPSGYTLSGFTVTQGSYNTGTGVWTVNNLASGANATLTITATVNASGSYTNTATITGTQNDPTPGNNSSSSTPTPVPQANLGVTKTANNSNPNVGSNVTFTIVASNAGPSNATAVNVSDLLPAGYTFISSTVSAGTYNAGSGNWSIGNLNNGSSATLTITATVNPSGPYTNTATITGGQNDPVPGNNSSSNTPTPVPQANLGVTKTVNNASPNVGSSVIFTITVSNAGPSNATGVNVTDVLPAGYTYQSSSATTTNQYNSGSGIWNVGILNAGNSETLTITAQVNPSGPYTNTASVSGNQNDPVPGNNSSSVTPTPGSQADISSNKTVNNPTPNVGDTVIFTITVNNAGPSTAQTVTVTDNLPNGYQYVSHTVTTGTFNTGSGIWNVGNMTNGQTHTLTLRAKVLAAGNYTNTAVASSPTGDPSPGNNTSTSTPNPNPVADLSVNKSISIASPSAGDTISFTITVLNNGPSNATGVTVTDVLPNGYSYVSSSATLGAYSNGSGIWSVGALNNSASQILTIIAVVQPSGPYANTATVSGNQTDNVSGNNSSTVTPTISPRADVAVSKSVNNSNPNVDDTVTFTVTVVNNGPSTATGVSVNDALPTGYQLVSSNVSTGNYSTGVWTIGNVPSGGFATLTIQAKVLASGNYTNTATVSATTNDNNPGNNTASASTTPVPITDLQVVKSASTLTPDVGDTIVFTIVATNNGPSNATGVQVTDNVPSGFTLLSSSTTSGTYNPNSGIWTIGSLNNGSNTTLTVTVKVNNTGNYTNTATITGTQTDNNSNNNTSSVSPNPTDKADLLVIKSVDNSSPSVGSNVVFTISITNNGPSNATGVTVNDLLPACLNYVSSSSTVGSYNSATGIWNVSTLNNGASAVLSVTATVVNEGTCVNTATVSGGQNDPATGNNTSSVTLTPVPQANLSVNKSVNNTSPLVGSNVTFTITIANAGPSTATNVQVNDLLPSGYTYVNSTASVGTYSNISGIWSVGTLTNGQNQTLTITATVNANGSYNNTATVSSDVNDPNTSNNSSSANTTPIAQTDLSIVKTVSNSSPNVGSNVTFTLSLVNNGPSNATGVQVTDALPSGYTYVSSSPSVGSYSNTTGLWTVGNLANGASGTLTIVASVNSTGSYANTATVSGSQADPVAGNNSSTVTPVPVPQANLAVTKSVSNANPNVGSTITFTIFASNSGPSNATGVIVNDLLPAGYTYVSSSTGTGSYNNVSGIWNIGVLNNGASATLNILVTVNASGPYANTATISGDQNDPTPGNNSSTSTPTPVPQADLSVTKVSSNNTPLAGNTITFTVTVTNNGPSPATGVVATDQLPSGYTYSTHSTSVGTYNTGTGVWNVGNLPNGSSATLTLTVVVNASGDYSNVASVTGNENDPSTDNNSATNTPNVGNTPPVAVNDTTTTNEDVPVTFSLVGNDTDVDGTVVASSVDLNPSVAGQQTSVVNAFGTWSVDPSGLLTFTPALNFCGTASIGYTVRDNQNALSNVAIAVVNVTCVNDPPVVDNEYITTAEDTPVSGDLTDAGDFDVDGNLVVNTTPVYGPLNGSIVINSDGTFTYSPALNFFGSDTIIVQICDDGSPLPANCVNDTIFVTVTPVNDAPVANNDADTTLEDTPISINVVANDVDIDGTIDASTVDLDLTQAGIQNSKSTPEGTWTVNATGIVTFTPLANFNGSASLTYTVRDNNGLTSNVALITIYVTPVNDPPVVDNEYLSVPEDGSVSGDLTDAGDFDVDGNLVVNTTPISGPNNGSIVIGVNGDFTYTPNANFFGLDTIVVQICDDGTPLPALCVNDTIFVTVTPVNDAPFAVNDTLVTNEDTPVTHLITSNDYDIDGTINTATVDLDLATSGIQSTVTTPAGTWTVNAAGNLTYTPATNYCGVASLSYVVNDNGGLTSNVATIRVTVNCINDAPVVDNEYLTTNEDTPVSGDLTDVGDFDVDGNLVVNTTPIVNPSNGSIIINTDGTFTYTPNPDFFGSDMVVVQICDDGTPLPAICVNDTIFLTILPVNDPPIANNDTTSTLEDVMVSINIISNDTDIDGTINPASVDLDPTAPGQQTFVSTPQGNWSVNTFTGVVTFSPALNFNGLVTRNYTVNDNAGSLSNVATIVINVIPVNDPPVVDNEYLTTLEDTPVSGDLTDAGDFDVDGNLVVNTNPIYGPFNGVISINANGTFTYTPNLNFFGSDTVIVQICDDGTPLPAICVNDTIFLTITPVNDPPIAVNDNATTNEDTPVSIAVTQNDSDVDGTIDLSSIDLDPVAPGQQISVTTPQGTWAANTVTGVVTFTPALNFNGTASIAYVVKDNMGALSNSATITVTVTPVNDPPVLSNEYITTAEDTPFNGSVLGPNDFDVDGNLVVNTSPVYGPFHGTISVNSNGSYTYTPALNYFGPDTVVIQICDDGTPLPSLCSFDTIFVTVTPVNDPPVANDDSNSTLEDTPVTTNVLANDSDIDGTIDPSTVDLDPTVPGQQTTFSNTQGTWTVNTTTGQITYTPAPNFNGTASVTYVVRDNLGALSNLATLTITVIPVNDPPVVDNEYHVIPEDTQANGDLIDAGDFDVDGNLIVDTTPTYGPLHGTIVINSNGVYTYTPAPNYFGFDTVVVRICDDGTPLPSLCVFDTIFVNITPVNDPPVINDDNASTLEDTPVDINVLANDTDIDGTFDLASIDLDPSTPGQQTFVSTQQGTWFVSTITGIVTFTPALNFNGTTSRLYTVRDNQGGLSNIATITVIVIPVNDPPVVDNEYITTPEDTPISGDLTDVGDFDVDGSIYATTTPLSGPFHGTIVIDTMGNYTYTPFANYFGLDTVVVQICDDGTPLPSLCVNDTIFITVTSVNDLPVANNDSNTTLEDTPVSTNVTSNDTDIDGTIDVSTVDLNPNLNGQQTTVTNNFGTWTVNTLTGEVLYTPALNFNGVASITYVVKDNSNGLSNVATLTINVIPVNDPPVVDNEYVVTPEDTPFSGDVTDAGDFDVDGNLVVNTTPILQPSNGTLIINANGNYVYTPNPNFFGNDMAIIQICDDGTPLPALCVNDTIFITVTPVNDPPVASNDTTSTLEDNSVSYNVLNNDFDIDGTLQSATVDLNPNNPGIQTVFFGTQGNWSVDGFGLITFVPLANYCGPATLNYTVQDNNGALSNVATIFIDVICVNDAPILDNEYIVTPEDTPFSGDLTDAGDFDIDGNLDVLTIIVPPSNGTLVISQNGNYTYTPNPNYFGPDFAIVQICDDGSPLPSLCTNDTLFITVTPVNDPPVANNDNNSTLEDTPVSTNVVANDSDMDGTVDPTTVDLNPGLPGQQTIVNNAFGSWSVNPSGIVTYTPALNYCGTASINYVVRDDGGAVSNVATLTITVNCVNDPPVVDNEYLFTPEDTPVSGDLTDAGDYDVDGNLVVNTTPVSGPSHGSIVINSNGTFTYTPNLNFNGQDTIVVQICDDGFPLPAQCTFDTIFVTVTPVNDPPVAVNDTNVTNEDVPVSTLVTANDTDIDGFIDVTTVDLDPATSGQQTSFTNAFGTWTVNTNTGQVIYTPLLNFCGTASVNYVVRDNSGALSNVATLTIEVNCVNDPPILDNEYLTTPFQTPIGGDLTDAGDYDVDGNLIVNTTPLYGPNNGAIVINNDGTFTYTPNAGFVGNDTVIVQICDDGTPLPSECTNDTIFIVVSPLNLPPTQGNEWDTTTTNVPLYNVNVLANNSDPEGDPLSVNAPPFSYLGGSVFVNPDGTITYNPPAGYVGNDTVVYNVCDAQVPALCVTDTLFITILPDNDGDGVNDFDDIDDDNDGIPDTVECATALGNCDTDGDGIIDQFDLDSDNDGIADIREAGGAQYDLNNDGRIDSNIDVDGDGLMDVADGDAGGTYLPVGDFDGDGRPNFQDLDSDNDGNGDRNEGGGLDNNLDGLVDDFIDANSDGWDDDEKILVPRDYDGDGRPDYLDRDSDNDGTSDVVENLYADANGDGQIDNFLDANSDGFDDNRVGLPVANKDGDARPNYLDLDSDNDNISDVEEQQFIDADNDGIVDGFIDLNNDGWHDAYEQLTYVNSDSDPWADFVDLDADQDGIPDVLESGLSDDNRDGISDDLTDANNNGWADIAEGFEIWDFDGDGIPDYLDVDTDSDGLLDVFEGIYPDANVDGIIDNFSDLNNDGWDDRGPGHEIPDSDFDGLHNFRDIDSDGDGLTDTEEVGNDCDNDGIDDYMDPDPCDDLLDIPNGFSPDGDGINDFFVIRGIEKIPNNNLKIFNRWGTLVYERDGYQNNWDGTSESRYNIEGNELPSGTYYYVLDSRDPAYGVFTGYVYVNR